MCCAMNAVETEDLCYFANPVVSPTVAVKSFLVGGLIIGAHGDTTSCNRRGSRCGVFYRYLEDWDFYKVSLHSNSSSSARGRSSEWG